MIQMCHLKALNQVLITFCQTAILECTLKVVGHFASWSHCARVGAWESVSVCPFRDVMIPGLELVPESEHNHFS